MATPAKIEGTVTPITKPRGKRSGVPAPAASTNPAALDTILGGALHPTGRVELDATILHPHPANPAHRSDADFEELAAAIEVEGEIIDALTVRPHPTLPGEYEVLNGHRRLAAARSLGWLLVPARVRVVDDWEALRVVISANQNRTDFTLVEEARLVQGMLDLPGASQTKVAEAVAKSRSWVSHRATLAQAPAEVLDALGSRQPSLEDLAALEPFAGTGYYDGLVEELGGRDFNACIATARRGLEYDQLEAAIIARIEATGAALWTEERATTHTHDWDLSGHIHDMDGLPKLDAFTAAHYYRLSGTYVYSYRPLTAEEFADRKARAAESESSESVEIDDAAAAEARAEARAEQARQQQALKDFATLSAGLRRDWLKETILTRKLLAPVLPRLATFAAGRILLDVALDETSYINGDHVHDLLPDPPIEDPDTADDFEQNATAVQASIAALAPANALLLTITATYEPLSAYEWQSRITQIRSWYALLESLGYVPSTAEVSALAVPAGDAV